MMDPTTPEDGGGEVDPRSILSILSLLPGGASPGPLTIQELGTYLATFYNTEEEKQRNIRHSERDQMYRDGGTKVMEKVIDEVFKDNDVRELRKAWVKHARYNNALKRIVNELSTVYSKPAKRSVKSGDDNYQALLKACWMDEQMLQVGRLLNLHRALLVGIRVRQRPDGTREPVIDIATPANVRAILHPNDSTEVVGWMIKTNYRTATRGGGIARDLPEWTVWTDVEVFQLRSDMTVIGATWQKHELGVIPWVPITLSPPSSGFWPGEEGEDLAAAHRAIWFTNVLLLKESKSATKQTIYKGDGTNTARAQGADTEIGVELSDGQSAETVDMSMDLNLFRATADHVLQHCAQNYGMSPALITHQGVQSAEARDLMRIPLKELREHQQVPLRRFEMRFVFVMSVVMSKDLVAFNFEPAGFLLEFGSPETPLSKADSMNLFVSQRQAGIRNTPEYMAELFDIPLAEAQLRMEANYQAEKTRLLLAQPLAAISGGMPNVSQPGSVVVPPEEKDSPMRGQPVD